MIIAHPNTEMLAKTLGTEEMDSLYGKIGSVLSEEKDGIITVKGDQAEYMAYIQPIEDTDWYLVSYVAEQKVLADLHQMEGIMAIIAIVATIALILAVMAVMNQVVKPVTKVTDVIGEIATGDFSQNLEIKGNDEIAQMSKNMQISESLKEASHNQYQAMEVLEEMVEELTLAADEVSRQMENLWN